MQGGMAREATLASLPGSVCQVQGFSSEHPGIHRGLGAEKKNKQTGDGGAIKQSPQPWNHNSFAGRGSTPYWSPETSAPSSFWSPKLASSHGCCMMQPRLAAGRPFLRPLHQERKTAPVPRTHRLLVTGCGLVGIERVGLVGWFQVGRWGGLWKVPRKGREGLQFQSREPPMWLGSRLRLPPRISVICWRADDCHRAQFQGMENSFIQTSKQTKY